MKIACRYLIVVDGRNFYDPQVMAQHGLTYISIGRPTAYPARELLQQELVSQAFNAL
jgi:UDPglucose 6-dehydrogenase